MIYTMDDTLGNLLIDCEDIEQAQKKIDEFMFEVRSCSNVAKALTDYDWNMIKDYQVLQSLIVHLRCYFKDCLESSASDEVTFTVYVPSYKPMEKYQRRMFRAKWSLKTFFPHLTIQLVYSPLLFFIKVLENEAICGYEISIEREMFDKEYKIHITLLANNLLRKKIQRA